MRRTFAALNVKSGRVIAEHHRRHRSLLNLAERDGRASYLSSGRGGGGTDKAARLEKIAPEDRS